jgi:hypothetical protein
VSGAAGFLAEVERACRGLPGTTVEPRSGYLTVTFELAEIPPGLSERAAALVSAYPVRDGRRTVRVDVRNRHWAALVSEIGTAIAGAAGERD